MTSATDQEHAAYDLSFAEEVYSQVEEGDWVKMCMQCGVCAGSCPLGPHWEFSPRKIFQLIRAGERDKVLHSESMWMCTSCYNCIVRCPRKLPITHIMHGLAHYALKNGMTPPKQVTASFAQLFWDNVVKTGRVGESTLSMGFYFRDGIGSGIQTAFAMKDVGLGLMKHKRMNPFPNHRIKGINGLRAMLAKAAEIEAREAE